MTSLVRVPALVTPEPTVSIRVAWGLVGAVEAAGVPASQLLRAARLELELLARPSARIPRRDVYHLCEVALELTDDPALGLHWAEHLRESTLGPVSNLIAQCATLEQGLEMLGRFSRLLADETSFQILVRDDVLVVRSMQPLGTSPRVGRFVAEMTLGGFLRMIRAVCERARPERACFAYAAPAYHAEYTRVFEGAERFGEPRTELVFDRALLSASTRYTDGELRTTLQALAERRLMDLTHRTPYALRVRELLVQRGQRQCTSMETTALALGLSVRSLRRRLAAEQTSYDALVGEALATVAKQQLCDCMRSVKEVAYEMGFASTSAFHRAFKRWTGMTPSAYRASQVTHRRD